MTNTKYSHSILVVIGLLLVVFSFTSPNFSDTDDKIIFTTINPKQGSLKMFLKNEANTNYRSLKQLRDQLSEQNTRLVFAMNGGMYLKDGSPQGLYIENSILVKRMDTTQTAYGNFYMQPNGVFAISHNKVPLVIQSSKVSSTDSMEYATQSGPMLVIEGALHPKFRKGSKNLNIRNGVGVLPDGNLIFAMSKQKINFYDFATFFKNKGCKNALYLDGAISRTYLPSKNWSQLDGNFGVIIGEVTPN